jgi:DNA repair exonuclease SbcCD ATPase subunit
MTTTELKASADDLRGKIAAIEGRQIELAAERDEIAYTAHVERDKTAVKRLAEINAEIAHLSSELTSLNAALEEAGRRATAAVSAEAAEAEKARAEQALPIAERLAERGKKLDAAIQEYCANFNGVKEDLDALARLGVPIPTRDLVRVNLRRANDAAQASLDKTSRPVPPNQRHSFDSLLRGWAQPGLNWIKSKLSHAAAKAA